MTSSIDSLKREATRLKKRLGISHAEALDRIASQHGYANWSLLAKKSAASETNSLQILYPMEILDLQSICEIVSIADKRLKLYVERHEASDEIEIRELGDLEREALERRSDHGQLSRALYRRVDMLSHDQRCELLALMWLGRGDSGEEAEDWAEHVRYAHSMSDEGDTIYTIEKISLPNYLRDGLAKLSVVWAYQLPHDLLPSSNR
jgi:hypothetical protein